VSPTLKQAEKTQQDCNSSKQDDAQQKYWEKLFAIDLPEGKCVGLRLVLPTVDPPSSTSTARPNVISSTSGDRNYSHSIPSPLETTNVLHPKEVEYGLSLPSEPARHSFFTGRLAMRTALCWTSAISSSTGYAGVQINPPEDSLHRTLEQIELPVVTQYDASILKDVYGRPQVPKGFLGSISHKLSTGVALVSSSEEEEECKCNCVNGECVNCVGCSTSPPKKGIGIDIERTFSRRKSIAKKVLTTRELEELGKIEVRIAQSVFML